MIDQTDFIYKQSLSIPPAIRGDVKEVVQRNAMNIRWSDADLKYIFDVYNRYLTREPENINCGGCRTKVVGKIKRIVAIWAMKEGI